MESLWQYSTVHNSTGKVFVEQALCGQTVCHVWLPNQDAVVAGSTLSAMDWTMSC
ncbi:hypothetical protein HNQ81_003172 [Desulfoprunum benzoelyticum]|uniref:Uncharacterized protein n=1 Tax=Desulfoprunum benzoelyticum TaxID=1506996 RepID=A0A840V3M8_9BACT|nr:hypothetical protein [Desulfoprunum benzoelyticum]